MYITDVRTYVAQYAVVLKLPVCTVYTVRMYNASLCNCSIQLSSAVPTGLVLCLSPYVCMSLFLITYLPTVFIGSYI